MKVEKHSTASAYSLLIGARMSVQDCADRLRNLRDLAADVREGVVDQRFATRACLAVLAQALSVEVVALEVVSRQRLPDAIHLLQDGIRANRPLEIPDVDHGF